MANPKKDYYSVVTDTGVEKMAAAVQNGTKVGLTTIAVGDGRGMPVTPDVVMTDLVNKVWEGPVGNYEISPESPNVLLVRGIIPPTVGGFTIREIGVYDSDGDLIAVGNTPDIAKVTVAEGIVYDFEVRLEIPFTNLASITIQVDPCVITASKKDIYDVINRMNALKLELEETIRNSGGTVIGPDAPENHKKLWVDTANSDALKYWNETDLQWKVVSANSVWA